MPYWFYKIHQSLASNKLYKLFGGLLLLASVWITWNYLHPGSDVTVCIFKNVTGYPCPSCGVTTSIFEIGKLNFSEAFYANPLGFIVFPMVLILPALWAYDLLRGTDYFYRLFVWSEKKIKHHIYISMPMVLLIILNWIYILHLI